MTRLLLAAVLTAARVFGRRERCAGRIGFKGVLGRSMAFRDDDEGGALCACETWDARGEATELGCVDGAVILRDDDECARTASALSSLWRDEQQPMVRISALATPQSVPEQTFIRTI